MKKIFLLFILTLFSLNFCIAQEWFTSVEEAKKAALRENKMLLVELYFSDRYEYSIFTKTDSINQFLNDHFVLLKLDRSRASEFYFQNKMRDWIGRVVILDINLNQLNRSRYFKNISTNLPSRKDAWLSRRKNDFYKDIIPYCINTSFLSKELTNYSNNQNFYTTFSLVAKYLDFAVLSPERIRPEVISLAEVYFKKSKKIMKNEEIENESIFEQRKDLLQIKVKLVLGKSKNAIKLLSKFETDKIYEINKSLYSSLYFISYNLLSDENSASSYQNMMSESDLKKSIIMLSNYNN